MHMAAGRGAELVVAGAAVEEVSERVGDNFLKSEHNNVSSWRLKGK
jgi:hypothetical protein